jgi:hypothetical protein
MDNNRIPKWEGYRGSRFVYANYYEQQSGREFLHDLDNDPDQLVNLIDSPKYAEVLIEMRAKTKRLSSRYVNSKNGKGQ